MTDHHRRVLYVGVTGNLATRVHEHQQGRAGFTSRYGLNVLVHYEFYEDVRNALQREKNIKHWSRAWKNKLVSKDNPIWADLSVNFLK